MTGGFWRYYAPLLAYMALIFVSASRARPASLVETPDLLLHGGAYFVLALLAVRAFAKGLAAPASALALWGGWAVAVVYGASDEWHQTHVPGRVGDINDVVYDGVGALLAVAVLKIFWRVKK